MELHPKKYQSLSYRKHQEMIFGTSRYPVKCGFDVSIGSGAVLPEVNYTLPPMEVTPAHLDKILIEYETIINSILSRMVTLAAPGVVLEFEHTPQMTEHVEIGARITQLTKTVMKDYFDRHQLKSAMRVTICDIREQQRPPKIRSDNAKDLVLEAFNTNADAGADMLSIESIRGKEVNDPAMMEGDTAGILFALGVLAPRDMHFLWKNIVQIAEKNQVVPAGDTACGFANTAMVLADKKYIPDVLAAVIRAMSAVRSLIAFERGAIGPSKDCAYEGPVIKAITGYPISMEGKSAACAHFSHVGNIAAAVCDLWSNESVQNVKLLSGYAPEVFAEILAYDCRLMNQSLALQSEKQFLQMLVSSDEFKSVHALIISPQSSFRIAEAIVAAKTDFDRTRNAGITACQIIREAVTNGDLKLPQRELNWLGVIEEQLSLYDQENKVIEYGVRSFADKFLIEEYGL